MANSARTLDYSIGESMIVLTVDGHAGKLENLRSQLISN